MVVLLGINTKGEVVLIVEEKKKRMTESDDLSITFSIDYRDWLGRLLFIIASLYSCNSKY